MATKYDVLEALVDARTATLGGDELGNNHVLAMIIRAIAETHGSEEELADAVYDIIADAFAVIEKPNDVE